MSAALRSSPTEIPSNLWQKADDLPVKPKEFASKSQAFPGLDCRLQNIGHQTGQGTSPPAATLPHDRLPIFTRSQAFFAQEVAIFRTME